MKTKTLFNFVIHVFDFLKKQKQQGSKFFFSFFLFFLSFLHFLATKQA